MTVTWFGTGSSAHSTTLLVGGWWDLHNELFIVFTHVKFFRQLSKNQKNQEKFKSGVSVSKKSVLRVM